MGNDTTNRRQELEKIAPKIWEMFEFVVGGRARVENAMAFFLAINTLFVVGFLDMLKIELMSLSIYYFIPFLFLVFPSLAMLTSFLRSMRAPWFETEELAKHLDDSSLLIAWFSEVYASAYQSHVVMKRTLRLLKLCLASVAISVMWLTTMFLYTVCCSGISVVTKVTIIILIMLGILICLFLASRNLEQFPYPKKQLEISTFFQDWLDNKKSVEADGK